MNRPLVTKALEFADTYDGTDPVAALIIRDLATMLREAMAEVPAVLPSAERLAHGADVDGPPLPR